MDGVFEVTNPAVLQGKHILLVDDVVTTGATLEACGNEILKVPGTTLSIATLAYTI
jgi:predicted amidophosphoribosyltransferase